MNKRTEKIIVYIFAGVIVTYAFVFLYMLLWKTIPEGNRDVVTTLSGMIVGGGFTAIISYFFGSTKGSADKTEIIANSSPVNRSNDDITARP